MNSGKISIPVFHGSLIGDIKEFRPCSHFGTRKQAVFSAIRKAIESRKKDNKIYRYACTIEAENHEIYHMSADWGSPKVVATLYHYLIDSGRTDVQEEIWREYYHGSNPNPDDAIYFKLLDEHMSEKGHKVLSYNNKHEGEGTSYMALYNACIAISSVIEIPEKEAREVFYENQKYYSMISGKIGNTLEFEDVFSPR